MYHPNGWPTCFDCRVAEIDPGDPRVHTYPNGDPGYPGTPPSAGCTDPLACRLQRAWEESLLDARLIFERSLCFKFQIPTSLYRDLMNDFDDRHFSEYFARYCPHFQSVMIDRCACCGTSINQPKFSWKLWAGGWEEEPVCSENCKRLQEKLFDYELREEATDFYLNERKQLREKVWLAERMRFKSDTPL